VRNEVESFFLRFEAYLYLLCHRWIWFSI
jgi:hypothetical protein